MVAPQKETNQQAAGQTNSDQREAPDYFQSGTGKFLNENARPYTINQSEVGDFAISFRNMDLKVIAQAILADTLGIPFSIDSRVAGNATFETSGSISKEALRISFETLLKTKGFALVNTSTGYVILPQSDATRSVNDIQINNPASASLPGFSVHVVSLKYTRPSEIQRLIEPFSPAGGVLRADDNRNMLILAGTSQELNSMFQAIETFDVDRMAGMSFAIFPLKYVEADQIIGELNEIFAGPAANSQPSVYLVSI